MKSSKKQKKIDMIELQEIETTTEQRMTAEADRKIISKEYKNLQYFLENNQNVKKYSWDVDGAKILTKDKLYFSREERKILKKLLLHKIPEKYRPNVIIL